MTLQILLEDVTAESSEKILKMNLNLFDRDEARAWFGITAVIFDER